MPRTTPDYLRPREPKPQKPLPEPEPQKVPKKNWKIPLAIGIAIVILSCFLLISGAIVPLSLTPSTTPTPTPSISNPSPITPAPIIATTPTPATSYVEVDYQTVGWFYGAGNGVSQGMQNSELPDPSYNYTYLVLNVTITNYGYSQVNAIGSDGFSAAINNNTYQPLLYSTSLSIWSALNNVNLSNNGSSSQLSDLLSLSLPNPATLLNTGIINGLVIFQFGNPNIYPQQPQILNEPFTLQYSVTYGSDATLSVPNATVVINQR
jgi:hypothetical protein